VPSDPLDGWTHAPFSSDGLTHEVYRRGSGRGVVLLPEIPGLTPQVMGLANHLVDSGFAVAVPSLFGTPGRDVTPGYAARTLARACITHEFAAFARRAHRPIAEYVRALARDQDERSGRRGVGVIGMCFSGGFALAAAVEPAVLAPVASQPSLPLPIGGARKRDLGMSDQEREAVAARVQDGLCLVGLRFPQDAMAPGDRFAALHATFGDGWRVIPLGSGDRNPPQVGRFAHNVLTYADVEDPTHPTHAARAEVVRFLTERLPS
jgi:dienelactone hydrolase